MSRFFSLFVCAALVLTGFLAGGCGYHMGSMAHPQIKTIAIAPVTNESLAYNAAADLRGMLCDQFMFDGSFKIKEQETADCIVYARIISVVTAETMSASYNNDQTYQAAEWSATVKVEFTVVIPGRKDPLVSKRLVDGIAHYQVEADVETNRRRGILMACRDAAQQLVQYTAEAF
ncbi:MAG: LPS assembly lipoprotein LptE [Victivallaceae bacterium]|jgi:outer membrane lipopolysaccharide assembly protein LptE/RlpB